MNLPRTALVVRRVIQIWESMITKGLRFAGVLAAAWLAGGCGKDVEPSTSAKPVDVQPADGGLANMPGMTVPPPAPTFGVGMGLAAASRDEFARNFIGIACGAYLKVCGCDAAHASACTAEHNLAAVNLYDCMFTRAYCASPAGASACPGIGDESRKAYLDGNALCTQLDAASAPCATWMRNTFGGQDGKYARAVWDTSDPYPEGIDQLIATCQAPPRQP
jgi:hypothetical protein